MPAYPPYQQPILDANRLITTPWQLFFNSLATAGGGGGIAPANATFVVQTSTGALPNAFVATSTASITVDTATPNQMQWKRAALTGDITASANSNSTTLSTTGVTAGTYGDSTHVGQFTVDAKGRLSAAANVAISGTPILKVTKKIVDADVKKLPGTPYLILAGPASGLRNKLIGGSVAAHIVTAYGGLDASFCALIPAGLATGDWISTVVADDASTNPAITHLTTFITGAAHDSIVDVIPYQEVAIGTLPFTGYVNVYPEDVAAWDAADWKARIDNNGSTADLTGGNAANYILVTLYYVVESLS